VIPLAENRKKLLGDICPNSFFHFIYFWLLIAR
jgi:hypothetical protein